MCSWMVQEWEGARFYFSFSLSCKNHCNGVQHRLRHIRKSILILDTLRQDTRDLFLHRVSNKSEIIGIKFTLGQYLVQVRFSATSDKMQGNSFGVFGFGFMVFTMIA